MVIKTMMNFMAVFWCGVYVYWRGLRCNLKRLRSWLECLVFAAVAKELFWMQVLIYLDTTFSIRKGSNNDLLVEGTQCGTEFSRWPVLHLTRFRIREPVESMQVLIELFICLLFLKHLPVVVALGHRDDSWISRTCSNFLHVKVIYVAVFSRRIEMTQSLPCCKMSKIIWNTLFVKDIETRRAQYRLNLTEPYYLRWGSAVRLNSLHYFYWTVLCFVNPAAGVFWPFSIIFLIQMFLLSLHWLYSSSLIGHGPITLVEGTDTSTASTQIIWVNQVRTLRAYRGR